MSISDAVSQPRTLDSSLTREKLKRKRSISDLASTERVDPPYRSLAAAEYGPKWLDWPAPRNAMRSAQEFILDIVEQRRRVLILPDKDADGLSAGTLLYKTLESLGLPTNLISVQLLRKGYSVHSEEEQQRMRESGAERLILLDQGSRPGSSFLPPDGNNGRRVLIIDHHMSSQWPDDSRVLTACNSPPIVTTSLLTYLLLRDLHSVVKEEGWRAILGVIGDLGPNEAKWGSAPWPSELGLLSKSLGTKALADAVAGINAPRRTADYNVPRAWQILLSASGPESVASHAFLKLCKLDVNDEITRWARTAPKFSEDGRVALIIIASGFQIHPVIATRWAGSLGRKSKNLVMIMCANTAYHPKRDIVSFSCRIASGLRQLPDQQRPDLIRFLKDAGAGIPGFTERVGDDFARGHKEATGGIIPATEFNLFIDHLGIGKKRQSSGKVKAKSEKSIKEFFPTLPASAK